MKRRSSGTTEDSEDSPVEVPLLNGSAPSSHDRQPSADRRTSLDTRPQSARSRRQQNINWQQSDLKNASHDSKSSITTSRHRSPLAPGTEKDDSLEMDDKSVRRSRFRSPWAISLLVFLTSVVGIAFLVGILHSAATRQLDPKGFRMSYMRPQYIKFDDFDTEHTRFASKYSLYLYREQPIEQGAKVRGTPILFIPGNAGSYKQVRPIASETAHYFHDAVRKNPDILKQGIRNFDFFTVDFNEDFTAFHGQTMEDQAEYVNEAIRYILSLYLDPRVSDRDPSLPDPTSVIVLGHSMGGIVARTMLVMPNYQAHSINTIITMSAPHARPPVTFDRQIVQIYDKINTYWREAYSQQWANNNPLWHVTLVSIAGGSLDTVVPSDYASVESLVPATHGFTVFTTTIPDVWTSMDHQSILWCEQFKKVVARTLFDIMDVSRGSQTKPRADRMRAFKKYLLAGMESIVEKNLPTRDGEHALALEDHSNQILAQGDRLVLRKLGTNNKLQRYFLPIPPQGPPEGKRFTLLTDVKLDGITGSSPLDVRVCSISPLHPGQAGAVLPIKPELAGDNTGPGRLECRDMTPDAITLPASTVDTRYPFFLVGEKEVPPFSYLQYDLEALADYQFVVVTDRANGTTPGFVVGEFNDLSQSLKTYHISIQRLLAFGMSFRLSADRQMVTEIKIPSVQSSLLAYRLKLSNHGCGSVKELFMPLVRQYLEEPYESKYFVNAREVAISLHGVSPYVPPPLKAQTTDDGLSLQFWTDPTCESSINIHLKVDWYGSLGKLNMRYRTVFGAFPLLLVALVLQKQFKIYDATGVFITFSEALDNSLRHSVPLILLSLTLMALSTGNSQHANLGGQGDWRNVTLGTVDFSHNDFLMGTGDPLFWFMTPLVGVVCIGVCVGMNYLVLAVTQFFGVLYNFTFVRPIWSLSEERRRAMAPIFTVSPPKRRLLVTAFLLFLISFTFPYQFAYAIACLVQLVTTARAHRVATDTRTPASYNFYNYAHSILLMMIWILPINLPILVVWVRNLAVHWLTPFSSHHNILLVTPFVLLVEAHASGKMVPRVTSQLRHLTGVLLVGIAIYAGIYGVSRAYMLHYLVNIVAVWLVALHMTTDSWAYAGVSSIFDGSVEDGRKQGKDP